jgi:hypothetical protein
LSTSWFPVSRVEATPQPLTTLEQLQIASMGLWEEEDYGILADKACWAMFAVTAGK